MLQKFQEILDLKRIFHFIGIVKWKHEQIDLLYKKFWRVSFSWRDIKSELLACFFIEKAVYNMYLMFSLKINIKNCEKGMFSRTGELYKPWKLMHLLSLHEK